LTLGRALDLLAATETLLTATCPDVRDITIAGDARRFEPLVFNPCIVGRSRDPQAAIDLLCSSPGVQAVLDKTARRALLTVNNATVDVRIAGEDEYGTVLVNATGSTAHLQALARRGWVEPRHVLNCKPVEEVRAFIEAKRRRKGAC
jgi:DNA polymerase/3'-5' exonuclease PolX